MLRLGAIMTRDVVTVTPETTLRDAVELFTSRHISGAPVMSGRQIVGVVSAADIIGFAASMPVAEVEGTDPPTWNEWNEMAPDEFPESENAAPGSYFTDLFGAGSTDVLERIGTPPGPARSLIDEHTVDEVMTRDPIALSPNDPVLAAADIMQRNSIHRILVVEGGKLVGIVSTLDLARAIAEHKLTSRTYVFNSGARLS